MKKIETNLKDNPDKFVMNKDDKWSLNVEFPYVDPLTYSPFHENVKSTFAYQKISADNRTSSANKNKVPDGACRKNASAQPIKVNKFKKLNDSSKRRHSTDDTNIIDSSKIKKSRRNSLLRTKHETSSNSSKSSYEPDNNPHLLEEKDLQDLDSIIPFPQNFDGKNNPFYRSPNNKEIDNSKNSNQSPESKANGNQINSSPTCNHQKRSPDKVEYRVVNNEPNKLVLTRVNAINENSFNSSNNSPLGSSLSNNSSINSSLLNKNGNSTKLNGTMQKEDTIKDDKKDFKVLGQRTTQKGVEYMLECTE